MNEYDLLGDTQLRRIFLDTFAYSENIYREWSDSNSFPSIISRKYESIRKTGYINPLIYAMYEPFIDTSKLDSSKFWFRLTVNPTFRYPYILIAEKVRGQTKITLKTTDGRGGYYPGTLDSEVIRWFGDSTSNRLEEKLHSQNFWTLEGDTSCLGGTDGQGWIIESISKGKYNVIRRWSPEYCGDETTRNIAKTALWLKHVSGMDTLYDALSKLKRETPIKVTTYEN